MSRYFCIAFGQTKIRIPAKIRTKFCSFADNFEKTTMKNKLFQISAWIAAHITLVVVLVTAVTLFLPSSFTWIDTSAITPMLGVVMFGMGLTLRPSDFRPVLQHPKDILVGELAQFLIMPSLAWLLCKLLSLPEELALGVILVGCCPGGTASNVICYLAKGDVALSYGLSAMTGSEPSKRSAIAIEVGMQNSGLATSLAATHFALFPMAAVPGAMFSVWHNFSGSIAAQIFRRQADKKDEK